MVGITFIIIQNYYFHFISIKLIKLDDETNNN